MLNQAMATAGKAALEVGGKMLTKAKANSPELLLGLGLVSGLAAVIAACKATKETVDICGGASEMIEDLKERTDDSKELFHAYKHVAITLGRKYMPAIAFGGLSVASILSSYGIMKRRTAALTMACEGLTAALNSYRDRVRDAVGIEKELELYRGITHQDIVVEDEETGKKKKIKKADILSDTNNPYDRCFDESCIRWSKDAKYNRTFLISAEKMANDKYKINGGHLFLNEVYDILGFERTPIGAIAGWSKDAPNTDGYVDFGLTDGWAMSNKEFVNGFERSVWLHFNCDGVIYDKI